MNKLINNISRSGKCFIKISGSREKGIHVRFNVFASELIGKEVERVNVFFDGKNVFIIPNKNGDYMLTSCKNAYHMSVQSLLNHIENVDFSKRYDVEKCENGIMFCLD